ncbi:hypothetical protein [Micromonospora sp. NPDC093244]|uniref:hypothetical protein n=1 Tax=Micromonospora sp. NPDC093244 TaxID=3155071 RepID=UPI003414A4C3
MTTYSGKKKIGNAGAVGIAAAICVLLCCGVGTIGALTDDNGDEKPVAAATATASIAGDRLVESAPTTAGVGPTTSALASPTPAPVLSPTPAPQRTSSKPPSRPAAKPTISRPKPKPTTAKPKPPSAPTVRPGAFCSRQGARGVTKTGKPMVCTTTATDSRKRWRAA